MDTEQILDLYDWSPGICFRHPGGGVVDTTVMKTLHPPGHEDHEIRACRECVLTMEDIRRETAAREGAEYKPGRLGEILG